MQFSTVSADVLVKNTVKRGRSLSPDVIALADAFRNMSITDAIEIVIGSDEKKGTVRGTIGRAAKLAGVAILTRTSPNGFYVGLKPAKDDATVA